MKRKDFSVRSLIIKGLDVGHVIGAGSGHAVLVGGRWQKYSIEHPERIDIVTK